VLLMSFLLDVVQELVGTGRRTSELTGRRVFIQPSPHQI